MTTSVSSTCKCFALRCRYFLVLQTIACLLLPETGLANNTKSFHTLTNPSFESQSLAAGGFTYATPPGWTETTTDGGNSFTERIDGFVHHGLNHEGIAGGDAVWQNTSVVPQAGRKYTLIAAVGNRDSISTTSGNASVIRLQLVNGASVTDVATNTVNASTIPVGTFRTFSASYTASTNGPAGSYLRVRLQVNSADRAHFDDVKLISCVPYVVSDAHPQLPTTTPAVPLWNSAVGHPNIVFLDFDGESLPAMVEYNCGDPFTVAHSGLNLTEMQRAFETVKEDFRPFRVNVTTDPARYWAAAPGTRMRCIITPTDTWTYRDLGPCAGNSGQASWLPWLTQLDGNGANLGYMGFQKAADLFHREVPCFVFMSTWAGSTSYDSGLEIGRFITHEVGHTFGLFHDGYPANDYFPGHGAQVQMEGKIGSGSSSTGALWSPIMGRYGFLTQWSRGEYANATNAGFALQDDVAILAAATGYFTDADNSFATANNITLSGSSFSGNGIITRTASGGGDVDYFRFTLSAPGTVNLLLKPYEPFSHSDPIEQQKLNSGIANLKLHAEIYRGDQSYCCQGAAGATSPAIPASPTSQERLNPTEFLRERFSIGLDAGTYYLKVLPTSLGDPANGGFSNYGNMGEYSFSASISWIVPDITSPLTASGQINQPFTYQASSSMATATWSATGMPGGFNITTAGRITGTPTAAGTYNVILRASTPQVYREETLVLTFTSPSPPVIVSASTASGEEGQAFSYQIIATGGATSYGVSGGLVPGLSVNSSTGLVSGIPTTPSNWTMTVTASNTYGTGLLNLSINVLPSVAGAVDSPGLTISYGGGVPWFHQTSMWTNGGDSAQSGAITHNQTSSFQTTVTGPYGLSFYWRTDCEPTVDFAKFEVDGLEQTRLSGNTSWFNHAMVIPAGSHTLKWSYLKNGSGSSGLDAAWVDQLVLGSAVSSVVSATSVTGSVGSFLSYSPLGTFSPISYSVSGTLPTGLFYSGPGNIVAGTPSRPGTWPVTVGSTNAYGTGTAAVTFTILSSFQAWASANSLAGSSALTTADPDRDGWNNLLEMAFSQNPNVRNTAFQIISVDPATKRLRATFTRKTQHLDLIYQVQVATTTAGPWTTIGESRDGLATAASGGASVTESGSGLITVTVTDTVAPPAAQKRFMRMKIIQQ